MQKTIENKYIRMVDFKIPMARTLKELEKMIGTLATGKLEQFYITSEENITKNNSCFDFHYKTDGENVYVTTEMFVLETLFTKTSVIETETLAKIITQYIKLHNCNASSFYNIIKSKAETKNLAYEVILQVAYNGDMVEDLIVKQLVNDNLMTLEMACALLKYVDISYINYITGDILQTILTNGLDNL